MKRKVLLCVLTVLVLFCSTQPAAALLSNERGTVIEGDARLPIIRVVVPTRAEVLINPYQMPVEIDGETRREQILCTPAVIASTSDIPLKVSITITGAVKEESDMTLATAPTGGAGTSKSAFVYFEIVQSNSDDVISSLWAKAYDPAKHIPVVPGTPQTRTDIMTLPPMTKDNEVARGGYAQFRLTGDAVWNPTTEWSRKDGINVIVAFTFTPVPYT